VRTRCWHFDGNACGRAVLAYHFDGKGYERLGSCGVGRVTEEYGSGASAGKP
jgi:hypothetical protein